MHVALIADGLSDRLLIDPVSWLLASIDGGRDFEIVHVDFGVLREPPRSLADRLTFVLRRQAWDMVLVHRDAEGQGREKRVEEMENAKSRIREKLPDMSIDIVPVIPVRMTEAWLLCDESAIRRTAGRIRSTVDLGLPTLNEIEGIRDPKGVLYDALRTASERSGRRLDKFRPESRKYRVAEYIDDWSVLEALPAFKALRADLESVLHGPTPNG